MENLIAKTTTGLAYICTIFSQDDIAAFFAIILSIVMTFYYGIKCYHERLIIKKERKANANNLSK